LLFGVSSLLASELPLDAFVAAAAAAGFRELELGADPDVLGNWIAQPAAARRTIQAAGLRVRTVHTPESGWNNGALDPEERRASAQAAAACLAGAAEVGAEAVVWHPTSSANEYTPQLSGQYRARALESLAEFAGKARAAGLATAVENLPRRGTPRPLTSVAELLPGVAALGADVGICLDAGHSTANGLAAAAEARAAGDRLIATHLQDCDGLGEDQHLLPGRGAADWPALFRALAAIGYRGGLIFEVKPLPEGLAATLAALAAFATVRTNNNGRQPAADERR
jgi:sugar phosphate isomerase/epimerase